MRNGKFLKEKTDKPESYIIEDLIARNRLVIWASPPGEGKSLLAEPLLYHIPYEAPYLGKKVSGGNVMIIDSENRSDILQHRLKKIIGGLKQQGYKKHGQIEIQSYSGFLLDDESTWEPVLKEIRTLEPLLILIDHLACFHNRDENSERQMKVVTTAIEKIMSIKDSSVLALHHFNKYDMGSFFKRLRGSSALYAKCDAAAEVRTLSISNGKLDRVGLIPQPRKEITPDAVRVKIEEGTDWMKLVHDGSYKPVDDPRMDDLAHRFFHLFINSGAAKYLTVNLVRKIIQGYCSDTELRLCLRFLQHNRGLITADRKGLGAPFQYSLMVTSGQCPWCRQKYGVQMPKKL